jgi:hypothetical protein
MGTLPEIVEVLNDEVTHLMETKKRLLCFQPAIGPDVCVHYLYLRIRSPPIEYLSARNITSFIPVESRRLIMENPLIDAQKIHCENPNEFWVPSAGALQALCIGSIVKVANRFERFWVIIRHIVPCVNNPSKTLYRGQIDSLVTSGDKQRGDYIYFQARHVYNIWYGPT